MSDPLERLRAEHLDLAPRPMPDLDGVIARGRRTQRRNRALAATASLTAAAAVVSGAVYAAGHVHRAEPERFGPAGVVTTTAPAGETPTTRVVGPAAILKSDWPQGYTPPPKTIWSHPEQPRTASLPADADLTTLPAGQLPVATTGPLKGVVNAAVTMARFKDPGGHPTYLFLDDTQNRRPFGSGDQLTAAQLVSVRALTLTLSGTPLGESRDLIAWTFPRGTSLDASGMCPETEMVDSRMPDHVVRARQHCDELFTPHPNLSLKGTPNEFGRAYFAELRRSYAPCLRANGVTVREPATYEAWIAEAEKKKGAPTWAFTDVTVTSPNDEPFASCEPRPQDYIPLLKGAENPPGVTDGHSQ